MSKYIGKRIVPKHCGEWEKEAAYEMLSIVLDKDNGDSYISRCEVPVGVELSDAKYWALCSHYNAQIEEYQNQIAQAMENFQIEQRERMDTHEETVTDVLEGQETYLQKNLDRMDISISDVHSGLDVLKQQVESNIKASTETGDYAGEVVDARTTAAGEVHETLGEALRKTQTGSTIQNNAIQLRHVSCILPKEKNLWTYGDLVAKVKAGQTWSHEEFSIESTATRFIFFFEPDFDCRYPVYGRILKYNAAGEQYAAVLFTHSPVQIQIEEGEHIAIRFQWSGGEEHTFPADTELHVKNILLFEGEFSQEYKPYMLDSRIDAVKHDELNQAVQTQYDLIAPDLMTLSDHRKMDFLETIVELKVCRNRFNENEITVGKYFDKTGNVGDNPLYFYTGMIEVTPGETLVCYYTNGSGKRAVVGMRMVAAFDAELNVYPDLGENISSSVKSYLVPDNIRYVRISIRLSYLNELQIEGNEDGVPTEYEAFYEPYYVLSFLDKLEELDQRVLGVEELLGSLSKPEVDAFLPDDIYCAVGRTIELYNSQVCLQSQYHIRWNCPVGKAMKRKFSITGAENLLGDYSLECEVVNDTLEVLWKKEAKLHIVSNTIENRHVVLAIGDSLTNNKAWEPEVCGLSDGKILFVGTRGTYNGMDSDGIRWSCCHEGRSGASASWYIRDSSYTYENHYVGNPDFDGTKNPFYDPANGKMSLTFYLNNQSEYLEAQPDTIMLYLGTNGVSLDNTQNADAIKTIVDCIRQDAPDIPIYVVNTLYRGNQNGIGVQQSNDGFASQPGKMKYEEDLKIMDLMQRLSLLLKGYSNLYFIPIATTHDSEYNFGNVETPVNPRAVQMEYLPKESVHPQTQGYYQMADCIWSVFVGTMN